MRFHILTISRRPPAWISEGFSEYAKRMPKHLSLHVHEIAPSKRQAAATNNKMGYSAEQRRLIDEEGRSMLMAIPPGSFVVALDERGVEFSTMDLAKAMRSWQQEGRDVTFLIGGADGLAPACKQRANLCIALSRLTFPHHMVRLLLAEQFYRAWSVLEGHPYHRS